MRVDMQRPSLRDRVAALLLLVTALVVVHYGVVAPLWLQPRAELNQALDQVRERERRIESELSQAPAVAAQWDQVRSGMGQVPAFLNETSIEQGAAAMLQLLDAAVLQASPGNAACVVTARTPLPTAPVQERFQRVAVQARLRCGTAPFQTVLYQLESGSPRLRVDNLTVLAQQHAVQPGESGEGLDVSLDLIGYLAMQTIAGPGGDDAP